MDYILKDAKKFYTVSLCYYELENVNEAESDAMEIFKLKNTFVGSFNDVEELTTDFYTEFCDMSPITEYSIQDLNVNYGTTDKSVLYNDLVKATEELEVNCANFHNVTISIADHELSDSGFIHRLYPNIVLSRRMVEERFSINGGNGNYGTLLICLRALVMEKFQLKYFDPANDHLMSCRGSEKGYILMASTSSVNDKNDEETGGDSYTNWTAYKQSKIFEELENYVSTQEEDYTRIKQKMVKKKPWRTTIGQRSEVKKIFDMNPYCRNISISFEADESHNLVHLEDDGSDSYIVAMVSLDN